MKRTRPTMQSYAGNPHVAPAQCYGGISRFDEGEVVPMATPRWGLYSIERCWCAIWRLSHRASWRNGEGRE